MPGVEPYLAAEIEAVDAAGVTVARAWLTTALELAGRGSDPVRSPIASLHPSTPQRAFPDTVSKTPTTVHRAGPILCGFTCFPELPKTHRTRHVILSPQRPTWAKKANRCKEGQLISRTTKPKGATGGLRVSLHPLGVMSQRAAQGSLRAAIWAGCPSGILGGGVAEAKWVEGSDGKEEREGKVRV